MPLRSRRNRLIAILVAGFFILVLGVIYNHPPSSDASYQGGLYANYKFTPGPVSSAAIETDAPEATDEPPPTDAPTEKPRPTQTPESYEDQRKDAKREFLASVDYSITADKIAGNPTKYEGNYVSLHCSITNVFQEGAVNAACGDDDTNIVLEYDDTNSLDKGQSVHVLGTVVEPMDGTNGFGGEMSFPTVKVEFME